MIDKETKDLLKTINEELQANKEKPMTFGRIVDEILVPTNPLEWSWSINSYARVGDKSVTLGRLSGTGSIETYFEDTYEKLAEKILEVLAAPIVYDEDNVDYCYCEKNMRRKMTAPCLYCQGEM